MKNQYDLSEDGRAVTIWLNHKGIMWGCKIDAEDLPKVDSMRGTWHARWEPKILGYYAVSYVQCNGKRKPVYMHRLIADEPVNLQVDHWNHEGLDNRRENLRVTTTSGNGMNRLGANRQSKTGYRGIVPDPKKGRFRLVVTIDGKRKHIGYFPTIEQALAARNQFPEYARSA